MRKIFSIFLVILPITGSFSNDYIFEKISTKQGLSQNTINCILQDSKGFLWFGTDDGLNRYDGYDFKTFRINSSDSSGLSSNLIRSLAEDSNKNIWIGTSDRGLNLFDYSKERIIRIIPNPGHFKILDNEAIISILPIKNNEIWILTYNKLLKLKQNDFGYNIQKINSELFLTFGNKYLRCLYKISEKSILVGTTKGMYRIDKEDNNSYSIHLYEQTADLILNEIKSYKNGFIILAINKMLFLDSEGNLSQISSENHFSFDFNLNNEFWSGMHGGLSLFSVQTQNQIPVLSSKDYTYQFTGNKLNDKAIIKIYTDKSGIIWVGTQGYGIIKITNRKKKFRQINENSKSKNILNYRVQGIYEDSEKNLWLGTHGGGISILKQGSTNYNTGFEDMLPANNQIQNQLSFQETIINDRKIVIACSYHPVNHKAFSIDNNQIKPYQLPKKIDSIYKPIHDIAEDGDYLWIGTYINGLYRYQKSKDSLVNFRIESSSISSNIIRSLLIDSKNRLWIGTDKGLNLLLPEDKNKNNPKFKIYRQKANTKSSLSHDYIIPIIETSAGQIWIGTLGGGLNKYIEAEDAFSHFSTEEGLPNNNIKGILEDNKGNLWISSNRGISELNPITSEITNFDISDGLQDYEFSELSFCKRQNGEMIFGGLNGFNVFKPHQIKKDTSMPDLVFTDIHVLNQAIIPGEKFLGRVLLENAINQSRELTLRYKENSFVVYYTALQYFAPEKIKYKYKLEGFDHQWNNSTIQSRFAKYTNLDPGKYTLKVLATNSDGSWMTQPAELQISVIKPWWKTSIAMLTYILMILLTILFFSRFSIIRIKMKNALMMERFEKEKMNELTQLKLRFFTNISHEFRTPLTIITSYLENIIPSWKTMAKEKVDKDFAIITRNINVLLKLVNQLMDFRKFEQGKMKLELVKRDIITFTKSTVELFRVLAEDKKISLQVKSNSKEAELFFDPDKMEKILNNIFSNAIKYTKENGTIIIDINELDNSVIIEIKDNGIGIPKRMQAHIFDRFYQAREIKNRSMSGTGIGLSFTKGLIEMHQGSIEFKSKEGVGSSFFLKFLKGHQHFAVDPVSLGNESLDATDLITERELATSKPFNPSSTKTMWEKKILIVEDNLDLRDFLAEKLGEYFSAEVAENGKEGLEKCHNNHPDLVISDIMMPEMDGYELCQKVKNNEHTSHIPVILLTAKTSQESELQGFIEGADAYISKPFNFEVLLARIHAILESRKKMWQKIHENPSISPSEVTITKKDEMFLKRILGIIEANMSNQGFTVEKLAKEYKISQSSLKRKIKALTNKTSIQFIRSIRLQRAAQLLKGNKYNVSEVTFEVGYSDLQSFREHFKKEFLQTPNEYKKQHPDTNKLHK